MRPDQILRRLAYDSEFPEILAEATNGGEGFFRTLAPALMARKRHQEALQVCDFLLEESPDDVQARLWSVQILSETGRVDDALGLLLAMRKQGVGTDAFMAELRKQVFAAAEAHGAYVASGELDRALKLCDMLVELYPSVHLFQRARLDTLAALHRRHAQLADEANLRHYNTLNDLANFCLEEKDFDTELQYRLEICRHPLACTQHSASRIINIVYALSRILGVDVDVFTLERRAQAQELLAAIPSIPTNASASASSESESVQAWEHTMRLLLGTINLQAIFDGPTKPSPPLPTTFVSSSGAELDIERIAEHSRDLNAEVCFVTSTSEEYFDRNSHTYLSSILKSCDCPCLIFVYICTPKEGLVEISSRAKIKDARVIYCSDDFDVSVTHWRLFTLDSMEPLNLPGIYYASSGLLHADNLLQHLGLPVFVTGIDTVLQRGVKDLIEKFADSDVVFNKMGSHVMLGGQLVNNLVLIYPTENGFLFINFIKYYHAAHVAQIDQPVYLDQLDIHMAKHHVIATGKLPVIRYFDPLDINNDMFNHLNYRSYLKRMRSFRFLNMFVGGCKEDALTAEDVELEAAG